MPSKADFDHTFQMRVDADFLRRVDDWRRQQPDIPSRAEAIRRLVRQTLDTSSVPK
jgi:metal-responsive CopG/Arc/MetJ family transcriptional regulator